MFQLGHMQLDNNALFDRFKLTWLQGSIMSDSLIVKCIIYSSLF